MPYSLHHLSIWIKDSTISMKLTSIKLTFVNFPIIPLENSISMHLSILERSLVLSSLCFHSSMTNFQISWELSYIFSFSSLHPKPAMTFHIPISERTLISFPVRPFIGRVIVLLHSINEISFISRTIWIYLYSSSVGLVICPLPFINKVPGSWDKFALSFHFAIFDRTSFKRSIRINVNTIFTRNFAIIKRPFKIRTILEVKFSCA